jgi:hypothetical protein
LENENPDWPNQQTVAIRFSKKFDRNSLPEIVRRVIDENKCRRAVLDTLARQATPEAVKFAIDPKTIQITDPDEAYSVLAGQGFTLLANGMWKEVLAKCDLLSLSGKQEPLIQLTLAYAYYVRGRCLAALACCGEAQLRRDELKHPDQEY